MYSVVDSDSGEEFFYLRSEFVVFLKINFGMMLRLVYVRKILVKFEELAFV